jgi:hypothetical protein
VRIALLAAIAASIAVAAATGAQAAPGRAACGLTSKTIKGHAAVAYCGPATATLQIGGTTYHFKGGKCTWAGTLILSVGTQVNGIPDSANNEGVPLLQLTNTSVSGILYAFSGHFHLGMSLVHVTVHGRTSGTFKGREPIGAARRFTGTYHC